MSRVNSGQEKVGPLNGWKVLDLTRLLPGPFCTMLLGDLGAEVIKIEEPQRGDHGRETEPFVHGLSVRHMFLNRNKKSLALNLKHDEALHIFYQLVEDADIVVESFRPGVVHRLNIDYETLKQMNETIIYASLTGYGQTGPYRHHAGHDLNFGSLTGLLDLTGSQEGPPTIPGMQIADIPGGSLMAALGILSAALGRETQGVGQYLDIAMLDGVLFMLVEPYTYLAAGEHVPTRGTTRLTGRYPSYSIYPTRDGRYMAVAALEEKFWTRLCQRLHCEELIPHRYATGEQGRRVKETLRGIFQTKTRDEWAELLQGDDTCCTPVYTAAEAWQDPHIQARQLFLNHDHPEAGQIRQPRFPIQLTETPASVRSPAPKLGEDTDAILASLGYDRETLSQLRERGAIH